MLISCALRIVQMPVSTDGQQMRVSILLICCLCISFVIKKKGIAHSALIYF